MWVIKEKDGSQWWTIHEQLADHMRSGCATVTEVVPASDLRASEELVQRLAEVVEDRFSLEMTPSQITDRMILAFGLRKVEGRWVKVNG